MLYSKLLPILMLPKSMGGSPAVPTWREVIIIGPAQEQDYRIGTLNKGRAARQPIVASTGGKLGRHYTQAGDIFPGQVIRILSGGEAGAQTEDHIRDPRPPFPFVDYVVIEIGLKITEAVVIKGCLLNGPAAARVGKAD